MSTTFLQKVVIRDETSIVELGEGNELGMIPLASVTSALLVGFDVGEAACEEGATWVAVLSWIKAALYIESWLDHGKDGI